MNKISTALSNRECFIQALYILLKRYQFEELTVEQVSAKSGLSRRTFYRYFESKDELLNAALANLIEEYAEDLSAQEDLNIDNVARVFFNFWSRHLDLLRVLDRSDLLFKLLDSMNKKIPEIYRALKNDKDGYGEHRMYVLCFSIGGFWNTLIHWMRSGVVLSPEEFAVMMENIVNSEALRRS
ncbi:TetR/AcrR family transcriptional regulator [Reinekea marinisedimentorum]|uniref:Regulatory TetR family protein n=1 Tax=Reinekea marinisedimentorum TaxID=230495 RepID=A0A4R3HUN4_9GAMM|nr:TetR/AcrR family transcriptional regulator [Reinekea marinisedimentorum]TCS36768.1 regulatory TetR family protein [Reinekea marinisedimentorum]